ncbi:hypothetical protein E2320_001997 [Naja naja]|nr:hypothetical protein E2320_001997 [Naja naja]
MLQRHLLLKGNLTFKMAIEESQAAELSMLSVAEIQGNPVSHSSSAVHYDEAFPEESSDEADDVNCLRQPKATQRKNWSATNQPPWSQPICLSYGGNHRRASYKFRNAICLKCQKKGHLARICQAGKTFNQPQQPFLQPTQHFQKQVEDCFTCYQAKSLNKNSNKISVIISLEGKPCRHLLSTLHHLLEHLEVNHPSHGKVEASRLLSNSA